MKQFCTILFVLLATTMAAQKTASTNIDLANILFSTRLQQIQAAGYELKAAMVRRDWGGISIHESELIRTATDTIYSECIVLSGNTGYSFKADGFTISRLWYKDKIAQSDIVSRPSVMLKTKENIQGRSYDIIKTYFTPFAKSKSFNFVVNYSFDILFLDDTKIDSINNDEEKAKFGSKIEEDRRVVIMMVYSRQK